MSRPRVAAENLLCRVGRIERAATCVILRVPGIYGPGRLGVERIEQGGAYIDER